MYIPLEIELRNVYGVAESLEAMRLPKSSQGDSSSCNIGPKDTRLASALIRGGDDHAKAFRGIMAYFVLRIQVGFMIEFETYRAGVECLSSSSSMHGELRLLTGPELAEEKQAGLSLKVYTRSVVVSYQTLRRMYRARRKHRHPDWQIWCDFIETMPHFDKLIMPEIIENTVTKDTP